MADYHGAFGNYLEIEFGRGSGTIEAYKRDVLRFRSFLDEGIAPEWDEVRASHIRSYLNWLSSDRRCERGGSWVTLKKVSPKYVHRVISSLRVFFDYLVKIENVRPNNPARELSKPKIPKQHPDTLTVEEITLLVKAALKGSRQPERVCNWTLVTFLYNTGLRISEFCAMRIGDVSIRDGYPAALKVIGKGNKERLVVLSDEASRSLHHWLVEGRKLLQDLPPSGSSESVCLIPCGRKRGCAMTPGGVQALLKRIAKKAGLEKNVHPHKLRHSFATEAVKNGAKIHGLQQMLGHAE